MHSAIISAIIIFQHEIKIIKFNVLSYSMAPKPPLPSCYYISTVVSAIATCTTNCPAYCTAEGYSNPSSDLAPLGFMSLSNKIIIIMKLVCHYFQLHMHDIATNDPINLLHTEMPTLYGHFRARPVVNSCPQALLLSCDPHLRENAAF